MIGAAVPMAFQRPAVPPGRIPSTVHEAHGRATQAVGSTSYEENDIKRCAGLALLPLMTLLAVWR
jgi:hypothetical protein